MTHAPCRTWSQRAKRAARFALLFAAMPTLASAAPAGMPQGLVVDPGPRGGPAAAGGPLDGLSQLELAYFSAAQQRFQEIDSVSGALPGESGAGLGPRFNLNSCAGCHAFPTVGGASPTKNPQIAIAHLDGARNTIPAFLSLAGPVREARFIRNTDGSADGGVHDLFTITGRSDAPGCQIAQPDFAGNLAKNNVALRIPSELFGLGLVESVPDDQLRAAFAAQASLKASLGISGKFNTNGNDGTITRFGWKAQNKSLLIFAGEAYNVEQGVTNEMFPNERETAAACQFNTTPEDHTNLTFSSGSGSPASDYAADTVNFAAFARMSAAPTPAPATATSLHGQQMFMTAGCQACHVPAQTTGASSMTGQSNVTFFPYSDFALHSMGSGLADGIVQGQASGSQFRTAPLWGIGQRLFFLHDGRTADLQQAILAHDSAQSEATAVIQHYRELAPQDQQAILVFLRSL